MMRVKEEPGSSPQPPLIIEAAGQRYAQTTRFDTWAHFSPNKANSPW